MNRLGLAMASTSAVVGATAFYNMDNATHPKSDPLACMKMATSSRTVVPIAQSKEWDARLVNPAIPHNNTYYAKCMLGGVLSCGLTHLAVTPLDVTKCNMQVNPKKFTGLIPGLRTIVAEEGAAALFKGWAPTAIGYSLQGMFKFGLYEFFKDFYCNLAGEEKYDDKVIRGAIYLAGSASAEVFADIALCPWEMVKVKVQTSPSGTWPVSLLPAMSKMNEMKAETGFPFRSLVPLWSRQIPYTMAKFFCFEKVVEAFYTYVFTKDRSEYSKGTQLGITFASGYIAGVICAIVSHPADSLVSLLGKAENRNKSISQIAGEFGVANLFTKGLSVRILMIGTLTGLQWWIYDTFKTANGMGTSGGVVKKKDH